MRSDYAEVAGKGTGNDEAESTGLWKTSLVHSAEFDTAQYVVWKVMVSSYTHASPVASAAQSGGTVLRGLSRIWRSEFISS